MMHLERWLELLGWGWLWATNLLAVVKPLLVFASGDSAGW